MQQHMLDFTVSNFRPVRALLVTLATAGLAWPGWAQDMTVTPAQKAIAAQVAQSGVPLSELAPGAPESYTVKPGDTLWAISGLFLKSPWRWPELWGMNRDDIANPNRIFPGQVLRLEKKNGVATLTAKGLTEVESAAPIDCLLYTSDAADE